MGAQIPLKSQFPQLIQARKAFQSGKTLDKEFRRKQLKKLLELFQSKDNQRKICEAVHKDMRKCQAEASITEIFGVTSEINKILRNFDDYTADEHLPRNLVTFTDSSYIRKEPHGVALIVGTWNYPFYISLLPVAGAIAAGNCILIKPSEVAYHSALLMAELIPQYLDQDCYHVVLGDVVTTKALLQNKFDYIFFTGSTNVGRSILASAAPHLTPVTLELGGKSPVYIDSTIAIKTAVKRILWGKFINMGQTCIAPDYILCTKDVETSFINSAKEVIKEWYGGHDELQECDEFPRIINIHHFRRLKALLEGTKGRIEMGGKTDEKDLWIEPTFVVNCNRNDVLMQEELFGPILPFVTVDNVDEAMEFLQQMARPLALYIFSNEDTIIQKILSSTRSGSVCINDTIAQVGDLRLPFGGTGESGMGQCHGKYSVDTFSHKRAVMHRGASAFSEKMAEFRYPPIQPFELRVAGIVLNNMELLDLKFSPIWKYLLAIIFGYFLHCLFQFFRMVN